MTMSLSPPRARRQSISKLPSQDSILVNCTLTYYYDKRYIAGDVHGEAARLALVLKGVPFRANRIKKKEIKDHKGPLPCLTLADGRTLTNKSALLRLVARETRLYSENDNFRAAEIDCFLDTIDELFSNAGVLQNASLKGDSDQLAQVLQRMDGLIDPETGYAVGDAFTMADLVVYAITRSTYGVKKPPNKDISADLDNILSVRKRVDGHIAMAKPSQDMDASFIEYQD